MAPLALARRLSVWLLAAALAAPGWSVERAAPVPPVYRAPQASWAKCLGAVLPTFAGSGAGGSQVLADLSGLDARQQSRPLAPIVHELMRSLKLNPEKFVKLTVVEQRAAVALAAEQSASDIAERALRLTTAAHKLVWTQKGLNKEQRQELFRIDTELREIDQNYGAYLTDGEQRKLVAQSAAQTGARRKEVDAAIVLSNAKETAAALAADSKARAADAPAPKAPGPLKELRASASAEKMLANMEASTRGWNPKDLETLYTGFGFLYREGQGHRMYYHPDHPQLHQTVSRHRELPLGYVISARKLIHELKALSAPAGLPQAAATDAAAASGSAPGKEPAALPLAGMPLNPKAP